MLYRGMDRAQLDAAYNNSAAVPERDAIVAGWAARSARVRRECAGHFDLAYGDTTRERLDLFLAADPKAPTLAFIHGRSTIWLRRISPSSPRPCFRSGSISRSSNTPWRRPPGSTVSSPRCAAPCDGSPNILVNTAPTRTAYTFPAIRPAVT